MAQQKGIPPDRLIGSRWVLTWKSVDLSEAKDNPSAVRRAKAGEDCCITKASLVLLGYLDPDLGTFKSAAPTLTRQGRSLILALSAVRGWRVFALGAKINLAGDLSSQSEPLYMKIPGDILLWNAVRNGIV